MDKILGTSLGRFSELTFDLEGRVVPIMDISKVIEERCNNYDIYKKDGVLVHMTQEEYENLRRKCKD